MHIYVFSLYKFQSILYLIQDQLETIFSHQEFQVVREESSQVLHLHVHTCGKTAARMIRLTLEPIYSVSLK